MIGLRSLVNGVELAKSKVEMARERCREVSRL